ncbi:hypothetical protein BH11ARM2_BH11ARM2_22990 [soil metagenome]
MTNSNAPKDREGTNEVPLESASPIGHGEIEAQMAAEQMIEDNGAKPAPGGGKGPLAQQVNPSLAPEPDKPTVAGTETNPKHSDLEPSTPSRREGP